jgi:hypothetical protein
MSAKRVCVLLLLAGVAAGGCGSDEIPASSLTPHLLPKSQVPGFELERTMDLSDPVDLVGQGIALPEATRPSAAVDHFRSSDLRSASGEVLRQGQGLDATEVHLGVARFESAKAAKASQAWMHKQDLQQPCYSECAFSPTPMDVQQVPGAAAVVQVANEKGDDTPANYRAEFTVGPYLYWMWGRFDARPQTKALFAEGVHRYFVHARRQAKV